MVAKVGSFAYKLNLPPTAKVHPVFHVSLLKHKVGPVSAVSTSLPEFGEEGKVMLQPVQILAHKLVRKGDSPSVVGTRT